MAVTAHFLKQLPNTGALSLETRLIAFRILHGSHTGANIGAEFLKILQDIECAHKESCLIFFDIIDIYSITSIQ